MNNLYPWTNYQSLNLDWMLSKMKNLIDDMKNNNADVSELETEFTNLQNYVNSYLSNLNIQDAVNNKIDDMIENGEWHEIMYGTQYAVWIGDSYVQANSLGSNQNKRFSTQVSNALGYIEKNFAVGGTGFSSASDSFGAQMDNAIATLTSDEKNRTALVVIGGGRNDAYLNPGYNYTQMNSVVAPVLSKAINNFPNAKILLIPMMFDAEYIAGPYITWYYGIQNAVSSGRITIARTPYEWLLGRFSCIMDDGVHPTVDGHNILAVNTLNVLNGAPKNQFELLIANLSTMAVVKSNVRALTTNGYFTVQGRLVVDEALAANTEVAKASSSANAIAYSGNNINHIVHATSGSATYDLVWKSTHNSGTTSSALTTISAIPIGTYDLHSVGDPYGLNFTQF